MISSLVNKMMACAAYLLSYYTWSNTSTLLSLKRPNTSPGKLKENWYTMPAFKRRAFRIISIEIGNHDYLNIPKYSMDFFSQLLEVSSILSPDDEGRLFLAIPKGKIIPLNAEHLTRFNKFIDRKFQLKDDKNNRLLPVISRFRATGSQLIQNTGSQLDAANLLGNTTKTIRRHYSTGNEYDNYEMLQDTVSILADKVKNGISVEESKERRKESLNVEILTYEKYLKLNYSVMQQAHGGYCSNPFGTQSEKFISRALRHDLLFTDKYACSDLLQCFSCPHQVIVSEITDIWCLLSFKQCIEESLYKHLNNLHFHKNYSDVINKIDKILMNIDSKTLNDANNKLNDEGPHPLWQEQSFLYQSEKRDFV